MAAAMFSKALGLSNLFCEHVWGLYFVSINTPDDLEVTQRTLMYSYVQNKPIVCLFMK